MPDQPAAQPAPPEILPQPLPTRVVLTPVQVSTPAAPTTTQLLWEWTTPAGVARFFTDRAFAQQIAQILATHLANWPAELVVPQVNVAAVRRDLHQPNGKG